MRLRFIPAAPCLNVEHVMVFYPERDFFVHVTDKLSALWENPLFRIRQDTPYDEQQASTRDLPKQN